MAGDGIVNHMKLHSSLPSPPFVFFWKQFCIVLPWINPLEHWRQTLTISIRTYHNYQTYSQLLLSTLCLPIPQGSSTAPPLSFTSPSPAFSFVPCLLASSLIQRRCAFFLFLDPALGTESFRCPGLTPVQFVFCFNTIFIQMCIDIVNTFAWVLQRSAPMML